MGTRVKMSEDQMKVNIRDTAQLQEQETVINATSASDIQLYDNDFFLDFSDIMEASGLSNVDFIRELVIAMERGRK